MTRTMTSFFLVLMMNLAFAQDASVAFVHQLDTGQESYDQFFRDGTLRIDYILSGNDRETSISLWQLKKEPVWGGPKKNLIDPWNSGNFRYTLYDPASGILLFSKGFATLFEEYQGTPEARKVPRAYMMTATMPYPAKPVRFEIDKRNYSTGEFETLFSLDVDPADYFILHEPIDSFPVVPLSDPGDPSAKLDIVFLAEGYRLEEMPKFREDARRISTYFLSVDPFSEYKERIAFWAVESPSRESGIDVPGQSFYANTSFNSSFYTFNSDRYLTTPDSWSMRDAAANVPYDQIIILNNSRNYGGGGFYNHYCQSTLDHDVSEIVAIHEFGHAFGGLADEYVGGVNYDGYYNLKLEPWEPNITTNVDFASKWESLIGAGIPIPTPRDSTYRDVVGLFEGGGYMAKGIYSPVMNCRMKDNSAGGFCPVCREAIRQKILYYCD